MKQADNLLDVPNLPLSITLGGIDRCCDVTKSKSPGLASPKPTTVLRYSARATTEAQSFDR